MEAFNVAVLLLVSLAASAAPSEVTNPGQMAAKVCEEMASTRGISDCTWIPETSTCQCSVKKKDIASIEVLNFPNNFNINFKFVKDNDRRKRNILHADGSDKLQLPKLFARKNSESPPKNSDFLGKLLDRKPSEGEKGDSLGMRDRHSPSAAHRLPRITSNAQRRAKLLGDLNSRLHNLRMRVRARRPLRPGRKTSSGLLGASLDSFKENDSGQKGPLIVQPKHTF